MNLALLPVIGGSAIDIIGFDDSDGDEYDSSPLLPSYYPIKTTQYDIISTDDIEFGLRIIKSHTLEYISRKRGLQYIISPQILEEAFRCVIQSQVFGFSDVRFMKTQSESRVVPFTCGDGSKLLRLIDFSGHAFAPRYVSNIGITASAFISYIISSVVVAERVVFESVISEFERVRIAYLKSKLVKVRTSGKKVPMNRAINKFDAVIVTSERLTSLDKVGGSGKTFSIFDKLDLVKFDSCKLTTSATAPINLKMKPAKSCLKQTGAKRDKRTISTFPLLYVHPIGIKGVDLRADTGVIILPRTNPPSSMRSSAAHEIFSAKNNVGGAVRHPLSVGEFNSLFFGQESWPCYIN